MGRREAPGTDLEALRVRMLGGFQVWVGDRLVEESEWRLRKAASLVKMLALAKDHYLHRERAMALLWPDLGERAAANNLRHALHVARKTLNPATNQYLRLKGDLLSLSEGPLWVDAEAFEEAAATARQAREISVYRIAVDLYAGDLLPGNPYEGWVEERRDALRRTYLSMLVELSGLHEERAEAGLAVEALRRAVMEEPSYEEAQASLMRLYALSGQRTEALEQYERFRWTLEREGGLEPATATRLLYEEIAVGRFPPEEKQPIAFLTGPPEKSPDAAPNNLPAPRTSFVGREKEILEVKRALAMTRLLTLTGAGGSGKTRLALEVARDIAGAYKDGVWLVELAGIADPALAPQEVASSLRVREQPGRKISDTLADHLRTKSLLLVLDNCEHVVDAAASLTDGLLSSCPGLRVLATSREALRIGGEAVWRVPSLSLPEEGRMPGDEEISGYESVRLFIERARQRRSDFGLTRENAGAVAGICQKLDGIPLAIELAAARVGVLSVDRISARLDGSLGLLRGGGRTSVPRHQTLRSTMDWSYDLLSEPEKKLFERLSVFAGGWTLEAAEAVGSGDGVQDEALDVLELLVDKSLVVVEASASMRYRLLEPVRQYAREKLEGSGEAEQTRRRHALWSLALAEKAEEELTGPDYQAWLRRLEVEHDNLRAALGWALDGGDAELGLRLAAALWLFWYTHGHLAEGRGWLERALAATA